jgi:hypothetical protein
MRSAALAQPPARIAAVPCQGALERLPRWLICMPIVVQWLTLGLRYRSLTLPTAANPAITCGGLVGEGKLEYFRGAGAVASAAFARQVGIAAGPRLPDAQLRSVLAAAGLDFPVVAKPDLGLCGYGVRRIDDLPTLGDYIRAFPAGETVVVQEYLAQEGEAGIFYAREPGSARGRIIGMALRQFPQVTGDGARTVRELIAADPRAGRVLSPGHACAAALSHVPAAGEVVRLATVGSTRVGGLYLDGCAFITAQLTDRIDAIARDLPDFDFGRFDVRYESLAALAAGRDFKIMEINGAGSEAIEAWDPATGMRKAFGIIFAKQRTLFAIAAARRQAGARPMGLLRLARLHLRQQRLIARYPPSN